MRWVFIMFLLLNLVYLGWELDRQFKIERRNAGTAGHLPATAMQLKLVAESAEPPKMRPPDTSVRGDTGIFVMDGDNGLVTELPGMVTVSPDTEAGNNYCYTFGPIEEEILAVGISDWFKSRRALTDIHSSVEEGKQLFWIYLAPQESDQDTSSIMADLRGKGIDDYRLISKGEMRNAISLGLYHGHVELNERVGELKQQGYQPIVVPYDNGKRVYWVDVRLNVNPDALAMVFKGYPSRYPYVPVGCDKLVMQNTGP
jgi:hypothetical protein